MKEDYEAHAQAQLASLKRDMRKTMEDATVRAMHKVMAEFEAKSDERLMEMPEKFAGFDVVVDASLPPGTMKFEQPASKPLSGYINRAGINANDSPITVVEKLERVIEATHQETQRIWQGLTDEEVLDMARTFGAQPWPPGSCVAFGQMVEAKLKEKNA